jgi:diguanylate cyclase (GGDEF)-like protein
MDTVLEERGGVEFHLRNAFPQFTEQYPGAFLALAEERTLCIGDVICAPDRAVDALTIVVAGKLRLEKLGHTIRYFGPKDYFGEGGLFREAAPGVGIVAVEQTTVIEFPRLQARLVIETDVAFGVHFLKTLLAETMSRLQQTSELFAENRSLAQELAQTVEQRDMAIEQVQGSEARMRYLATHDPLTQLGNRALLRERMESMMERARRFGTCFAMHVIDLDHFKEINDVHGHPVGDKVLIEIAERVGRATRGVDVVVRLGGDEFAVLQDLSVHGETADAGVLAERLITALAKPIVVQDVEMITGCSVGVSIYPNDGSSPEDLMRNADLALYRAKHDGRGRYAFFTESLGAHAVRAGQMKTNLRRSAIERSLSLSYQPKIDLKSGDMLGMEALARWYHPDHGNVSPAEFIPIAERGGLIGLIGEFVLEEACLMAAHWREQGMPGFTIAVNLSPVQFKVHNVVAVVDAALRNAGLPAEALELEVTESILMSDAEDTRRMLRDLQERGVSIAIDDFGTGYSSLTYLRKLAAKTLKIDRSFVQRCSNRQEDEQIVRAIIGLAHDLDMQVVAEGVETIAQLSTLQKLRCDSAQGYLVAKPLDPEELSNFILGHSVTVRHVTFPIKPPPL